MTLSCSTTGDVWGSWTNVVGSAGMIATGNAATFGGLVSSPTSFCSGTEAVFEVSGFPGISATASGSCSTGPTNSVSKALKSCSGADDESVDTAGAASAMGTSEIRLI